MMKNGEIEEKNNNIESRNGENAEEWRSHCSTWSFNRKRRLRDAVATGRKCCHEEKILCVNGLLGLTE